MYFKVHISVIWNIRECGVLMNGELSVLKIKAKIVNVYIWSANTLLQ
jgi:hypothetical protein